MGAIPERAYWYDQNRLGYGNVGFVDTHVKYLQDMYNKSGFERGSTCFFLFTMINDPPTCNQNLTKGRESATKLYECWKINRKSEVEPGGE